MNKKKFCSCCGQRVLSMEELEKELGEPILYIIRNFESWKKLKEKQNQHSHTQDNNFKEEGECFG